jgi:Uma2 family endonuclease
MAIATLITADEFAQMSFDRPVELIRGEVVELTSPGGVHGRVCFNVNRALAKWPGSESGFGVYANDTGVLTEQDPDTVRGPDIAVLKDSSLPGRRVPRGVLKQSPDVCIEVRSPSDRWSELLGKVGQFLDAGVKEVWVIDPDTRRVHLYTTNASVTVLHEGETLRSSVLPELEVAVSELFKGVAADDVNTEDDSP